MVGQQVVIYIRRGLAIRTLQAYYDGEHAKIVQSLPIRNWYKVRLTNGEEVEVHIDEIERG